MSKSKSEKPKMATSWEIYNRIIWDSRLDSSVFIAGFEDRISDSGIREKSLAHWAIDGEIPWHRIRYIRCQDIIVWDREQHLDLISSGHLPAFAWKINQTDKSDNKIENLEKQPVVFNPKYVYKYENNDWQPVENISKSVKSEDLTIASYNVLCDVYEKDKIQTEKRLPAIFSELRKTDADIIAIQEATPDFIKLFLAQDWLRDYYYVSESNNTDNIQTFGNLLLSRLPFTLVEYKFSIQKHVLVGSWFINNELLQVAVVHLTSNRAKNAVEKRKSQLTTIVNYLETQPGNYLIVGDFNTRNNLQDDISSISNFIDIWQELYPDEAGYTFNPQVNPLAELMSLGGEPARFDRILLNSQNDNWVPQSVELFGCEPVENTEEKIFPSDHFGIRAVVNLTPSLRTPLSLSRRGGGNSTPFKKVEENLTPSLRTPLSLLRRGGGNLTPFLSRRREEIHTPLSFTRRGDGGEVNDELKTISPVYRSAIVILPPDEILPAIQAIRQRYDARFDRWMPHINLIYGFLPESYFDEVAKIISSVLAQVEPFTVTLNSFETFTHRKSSTVWLRPIAQPETALQELQSLLQQLFPQCNEQSRKSEVGFTPHLSVGQFSTPEEAFAKLPQWHPQSFTVKSIALISRRGDEPFEVRRIINFGEGTISDSSELINLVNQIEPKLNQNQKNHRETVLEIITQACQECLGFQPTLELLGSYRLGVESTESDLDIVCQIPIYLSGENFLKNVYQRLEGLCENIKLVLDAKVPLLRLKLEGISVDLLYAHFDGNSTFDISIIGCWEADLIAEFVQEYLPIESFKLLLRAIKGWAKSRRVYGNSWGFLGGLSLAILSAWSCQYYDDKNIYLDTLLLNLFKIISQHDWNQPITLTEVGKEYSIQLPRDLLPIITSIEPCQNTARNITRSTAEILRREFARGAELTQEIINGNLDWSILFESIDLQQEFDILLELKLVSDNHQELEQKCGNFEADIIGLVIQLEQNDIFVRPWTGIHRILDTAVITLGLNLPSDCNLNSIETLALEFLSQFGCSFEVRIQKIG